MQANQVVVFPDKDTTEYLSKLFLNCPFDVDINSLYVVLNETREPADLQPSRVYLARAGKLDYWYDVGLGGTSLILPLISDQLLMRMAELRIASGSLFHPSPLAFMVIKDYMPPLARPYRNFVVSVTDMLLLNEQPLVFTGETHAYKDFDHVPYQAYYEDRLGA